MKIWRGKKRLAMKAMTRQRRKLMEWAVSIKPGDYIATCEGCNRKVAKIDFVGWANEGDRRRRPNKTRFVFEVAFEDTHGRLHYCPGGGCAYPAETPQQVTDYFRGWAFDPGVENHISVWLSGDKAKIDDSMARLRRLRDALTNGRPIVDEHGELLPEFDRKFL